MEIMEWAFLFGGRPTGARGVRRLVRWNLSGSVESVLIRTLGSCADSWARSSADGNRNGLFLSQGFDNRFDYREQNHVWSMGIKMLTHGGEHFV